MVHSPRTRSTARRGAWLVHSLAEASCGACTRHGPVPAMEQVAATRGRCRVVALEPAVPLGRSGHRNCGVPVGVWGSQCVVSYGFFTSWFFGEPDSAFGWVLAATSAVFLTMPLWNSDGLIRQRLRRACGGPNSLPTASTDIEQSLLPPVVQAVGPEAHGEDSF